jgi:predicted transcriptional regulator
MQLSMTAKKLKDVLEIVEAWPEAAQAELAELALEIDAGLGTGKYHATPEELPGIERGLKAAREGRLATDEQIEQLFKKHRPA